MSGRSRFAGLVVAILACLAALVVGAASSQGAPGYVKKPTLSLSSTNVNGCGPVTVTGADFAANESVTLTLHTKTYPLTTVQTDGNGAFSVAVTLPTGVNGTHTIVATGAKGDTASAKLTISNCGEPVTPPASSGGGLSTTGVAVLSIGGLGVVLLGAGMLLVLGARRRRTLA